MQTQQITLRCTHLLFDMDGTLINSHAPMIRAYTAWAQSRGLDPQHVLRESQGRRTIDSMRALLPAGIDVEADALALMQREREDTEGVVEIPGAGTLLRALPADRWAVVTSADRQLALVRLKAAGLPLPSVLVSAEDVVRGKPAPDGFKLGAQRLGADAASCIVFEDAPAGIAAGLAAGARVIAIGQKPMAEDAGVEMRLVDLQSISVSLDGRDLVLVMTAHDACVAGDIDA
jgi:sugar-phosphatase